MFNIEKYLEKFSKEVKLVELHKAKIVEIINEETQMLILPKNMEIKDAVLLIKDSPAVKNKLFMHKAGILEKINSSTPIKVVDIR